MPDVQGVQKVTNASGEQRILSELVVRIRKTILSDLIFMHDFDLVYFFLILSDYFACEMCKWKRLIPEIDIRCLLQYYKVISV